MVEKIYQTTSRDAVTGARTGLLTLPHGPVETPVFMPVGTAGTVKAMTAPDIHRIGFRLLLGNTYHLYLRPGVEVLSRFGGLHAFSRWNHNILTDSGGFQIFSLSHMRKITEDGVTFQSHIDGSRHALTPERVVDIQVTIGSDIQMALDVCTGPDIDHAAARAALETTSEWAIRAKRQWTTHRETYRGILFPIVQGNFYHDLRKESVERTVSLDLPGIAIGGLSVGEPFDKFVETLARTMEHIPAELPRYVMGIGTPEYILAAIEHGVDMFDCVFPTRAGRNGLLFTTKGRINLKNARWALDTGVPDPEIDSFGGERYSLGYLHHLFKSGEILGSMLASRHNLAFLHHLVFLSRNAIREGSFSSFKERFLEGYGSGTTRA